MSIRQMLTQTCTIQDKTEASTDDYGHSVYTWTSTATLVPCRLYGFGFGTETVQQKETGLQDFLLDLLPDQTITNASRVVHEDGNTYEVKSIRAASGRRGKTHHKIVNIKLVA